MPKGPRGEKRPPDVIGAAVLVGRIATGEADDTRDDRVLASKKGGEARARSLSEQERAEIAKKAAKSRWEKARAAPGLKEPS